MPDTSSRSPTRRAAVAAGAAAALVVAGAAGWAVAGPPPASAVVPPPSCPPSLAQALPGAGPGPGDLVPWGPSSARVCVYPASGTASGTSGGAGAGRSAALDATTTAELAGLLHPLPDSPASCAVPAARGDGSPLSVVVFTYLPRAKRPRTAPEIAGTELRVVLRSAPCATASNGTRTVELTPDVVRRVTGLVPVLGATFPRS